MPEEDIEEYLTSVVPGEDEGSEEIITFCRAYFKGKFKKRLFYRDINKRSRSNSLCGYN